MFTVPPGARQGSKSGIKNVSFSFPLWPTKRSLYLFFLCTSSRLTFRTSKGGFYYLSVQARTILRRYIHSFDFYGVADFNHWKTFKLLSGLWATILLES